MAEARADLLALLARDRRRMDGIRRRVAAAAAAAVLRHASPDGTLGPGGALLAMREIDRELDRVYGAFRGDGRAELLAVMEANNAEARELAVDRSAQAARRAVREADGG